MKLLEFFKLHKKCSHPNFPTDKEYGYCPDCGEFIENQWFMTRCACCGIKIKAMMKNGKIVPVHKYCQNCGSDEFAVQKLPSINFIDIHFAVVKKTVVNDVKRGFTQTWVDSKTSDDKQQLLPQFR